MNQAISSFKTIKKEIPSLYVLKALCAFSVVLLHTGHFYREAFIPLYRLAVPLFFMISGYFMVTQTGTVSTKKLWKNIKKLFFINLTTTFIYLSYSSLLYIRHLQTSTEYYNILMPKHFWENLFLSNPYPYVFFLWYIIAYIEALLIVILFVHIKQFTFLLKIFPLFFILGLFMGIYNNWNPFEEEISCYHRNFLTIGLPFLLLGSWIKIHQKQILSFYEEKNPYFIIITCLILTYLEYFILTFFKILNRGDYWLSTIFLAMAVFLYFIRSPYLGKDKKITNGLIIIGRDYSLFIYLYHILLQRFFILIGYKLGISYLAYHNYESLIVLCLTLLTSIIIKILKNFYLKKYA